jgi:hypothetical protein
MLEYDAGSKWMIQRHGGAIIRMSGFRNIGAWKAVQAEPVHPRRLPDGLIEVQYPGRARPTLFVLEVSTYPYQRLAKQAADDALLVYLDRGVLPEVVTLVLHPRGKKPIPSELTVHSDEGSTHLHISWKLVELWKVPAEDMLAADDIGLIPWVPLAQFDGPPEPIFRECHRRIERVSDPKERESLLVVTHFLAGLKYNDPRLFQLLGGKKAMFKTGSPVLQEMFDEVAQKAERNATESAIVTVLVTRFGTEAEAVKAELKIIRDDRFERLLSLAASCPDLDSFRKGLAPRRRRRGK